MIPPWDGDLRSGPARGAAPFDDDDDDDDDDSI